MNQCEILHWRFALFHPRNMARRWATMSDIVCWKCALCLHRTFDMDEWKRTYSNEDTEKVALPYFWSKFDKENYSVWFSEYAEDLSDQLVFQTCNLVSGKMPSEMWVLQNMFPANEHSPSIERVLCYRCVQKRVLPLPPSSWPFDLTTVWYSVD